MAGVGQPKAKFVAYFHADKLCVEPLPRTKPTDFTWLIGKGDTEASAVEALRSLLLQAESRHSRKLMLLGDNYSKFFLVIISRKLSQIEDYLQRRKLT